MLHNIVSCHLYSIIILFMTQSQNQNLTFEKIGFVALLVIEYYTVIINIIYFFSTIMATRCTKERHLINMKRSLEKINEMLHILLPLVIVFTYLFSNFQIKSCFIGSCVLDRDLKYFFNVLPYQIEYIFLLMLFITYIISALKSGNDEQKLGQTLFGFKDVRRVIIYEFFYMIYILADNYAVYQKVVKLEDYRFDDYCSIHDFKMVIKTIILFVVVGLDEKNFEEWQRAFKSEEEDDKECEEMIEKIYQLNSQLKQV